MTQFRMRGFYINLDRAADRRAAIDADLKRHALDAMVKRFPALQGDDRATKLTPGELGCFLSHQTIITAGTDDAYTLILEDDVLFPENFGAYFRPALTKALAQEWDILFLTQAVNFLNLVPLYILLKQKKSLGDIYSADFRNFITVDSKAFYNCIMGAYVVHPKARAKIGAVLEEAAASGYALPIDILIKKAINESRISAKFLFPYLLGLNPEFETQMQGRASNPASRQIIDCVNLFVAGLDISTLETEARAQLAGPDLDSDALIASQILYRELIK